MFTEDEADDEDEKERYCHLLITQLAWFLNIYLIFKVSSIYFMISCRSVRTTRSKVSRLSHEPGKEPIPTNEPSFNSDISSLPQTLVCEVSKVFR